MYPDFNKKTIDTLAKRAAFKCSNPECRVNTVGPNTDPQKSTLIGEAAHIYGARPNSKRYIPDMSDAARAEITNAIWLCRNCHKIIDTDELLYSSNILFKWREQHEEYVLSELGNATDRIRLEEQSMQLSQFEDYPPIISRIVIDKPDGWEWRLTAELMRHLNQPIYRKIEDLQSGLYLKQQEYVDSEDIINWVRDRVAELSNMIPPIVNLFDRLNSSWGPPGVSGNVEEIHHICCLISDYLEQIVLYEEKIYFTNVPEEYENLIDLFKDLLSSQVMKFRNLPRELDDVVDLIGEEHGGTIDKPHIIKKEIDFELPKGWEKKFNREFKRARKRAGHQSGEDGFGCWFAMIIIIIFFWFIFS